MKHPATIFGIAIAMLAAALPNEASAQEATDLGVFPTWEKKPAPVNHPKITDGTKVITFKNNPTVYPVHDGVFAISENGMLSFFLAESGDYISRGQFKSIEGQFPSRFCGNSAMVRSTVQKGKYTPYVILNRDGSYKELYPEWVSVSNFADGLARVGWTDHNYLAHTFFINEKGEKTLPALNFDSQRRGLDGNNVTEAKPLSEGLRAFYSRNAKSWGYLDSKGNVAIKPQFTSGRAFHEGYAAVTVKDEGGRNKLGFVDKQGTLTFKPTFNIYNAETDKTVGDVRGGIICHYDWSTTSTTYYSPQGEALKRFQGWKGSEAAGGHVFLMDPYDEQKMYMLSSSFKPLREINCDEGYKLPEFTTITGKGMSLATVSQSRVINSDGDVVLAGGLDDSFGDFCDEGYCLNTFSEDYQTCYGIMRTDGTYSVILVPEDIADKFKHLKESKKADRVIPPGTPPKTPQDEGEKKYPVSVVCNPEEGGTATGAGKYPYGTIVEVNATANQGYRFSGLICSDNGARQFEYNKFEVRDTLTILAQFIRQDDILPPARNLDGLRGKVNFAYDETDAGLKVNDKIDLYMELSTSKSIDTPYGKRFGFMQIQFDPEKAYTTSVERGGWKKNEKVGTTDIHFYSAPYEILGFMKADGKKWMVIDGGGMKALITKVNADTSSNIFAPLQFFILFMDGMAPVEIEKKTFRIEIKDEDAQTGAITFGKLQAFSPQFGWVGGKDRRLHSAKFVMPKFVTVVDDGGFAEDFFDGVVMTPSEKCSSIEWSTPKEWFGNVIKSNKNGVDYEKVYERVKKGTMDNYSKFKSNFTQFWE